MCMRSYRSLKMKMHVCATRGEIRILSTAVREIEYDLIWYIQTYHFHTRYPDTVSQLKYE
jgi:hypothetical protein